MVKAISGTSSAVNGLPSALVLLYSIACAYVVILIFSIERTISAADVGPTGTLSDPTQLLPFITGVIGGVHAAYLGTIEPYSIFDITWTTTAVNIAIIGGIGTLMGPIVGAIFMVFLSENLADYQTAQLIITGVILILVIRFLPLGIWGTLREWVNKWVAPRLPALVKRIRRV